MPDQGSRGSPRSISAQKARSSEAMPGSDVLLTKALMLAHDRGKPRCPMTDVAATVNGNEFDSQWSIIQASTRCWSVGSSGSYVCHWRSASWYNAFTTAIGSDGDNASNSLNSSARSAGVIESGSNL